jgi:ArsR family transcriptional regulator
LARVLQSPQPTISRHLKLLDDGGWVARRKSGTASYFRLAELGAVATLWGVVKNEVESDPSSLYTEDMRRLEAVVAARSHDSEEMFRRLGGRWDGVRAELFGESFALATLLSMLPSGLRVADIGCGTGATLPLLSPVVGHLVGIDREEAMLAAARERTVACANVQLLHGFLDDLPLLDGATDVVLSQLVLHHVRALPAVFAEVHRVLAPGGRWVILDMVEHDREEYRSTMGHQHLGFSASTLDELACEANLRVASHRVLPVDPAAQGPGLFVAILTGC